MPAAPTRPPISFTKHHGLANDFLVLLDTSGSIGLTLDEGAALARHVCDRHRGIGADGLLLALPAPPDGSAVATMRLHNADGSVAEMSGNGIRCFVQALLDAEIAAPGAVRIHTDAGLRTVLAAATSPDGVAQIQVDMGVAKVGCIEVDETVRAHIGSARVATVDVGNPHIVIEGEPAAVDLASFGPAVEAPYLARLGGINVEVIAAVRSVNATRSGSLGTKAAEPDSVIDMVVWERGAGITQACGTGATAAALVAHRWGIVGRRVRVRQPGGDAIVEIGTDHDAPSLTLIGPSQYICTLTIPADIFDAVIGRS